MDRPHQHNARNLDAGVSQRQPRENSLHNLKGLHPGLSSKGANQTIPRDNPAEGSWERWQWTAQREATISDRDHMEVGNVVLRFLQTQWN
jgi:hypothetical protein